MESSIFTTLSKRMKGRRMSWSTDGADNLAKILCEQKSKRLSYYIIRTRCNKFSIPLQKRKWKRLWFQWSSNVRIRKRQIRIYE